MKVTFIISFLTIFTLSIYCGEAYRILGVFSYHGKSHFMMYGALLRRLAERGHQVDVVSHFPPKKPLPNYNQLVNLHGIIPTWHNNLTYEFIKTTSKDSEVKYAATKLGTRLCEFLELPKMQELIKNPPKDPPYDLLISDVFGATCYLALGQHFKIPIVGTVSSVPWPWVNDVVANPDNPAYIPSVFTDYDGKMNFWERLTNTLQLIREKWEFHYYTEEQSEMIKRYIGPHAPSVREAERNVSLLLVNTHYSLNGVKPNTAAVVEVGGLHIFGSTDPLPKNLEKWLNESTAGFVYISFGAMTKIESFPRETLHALYASLAKLSPIRILMKIAKPQELPPGLPDNVLVNPWIPQLAVLKHKNVRAFMTHGGLMGTMEAIWCGVPMIGVPLFADQGKNMNAYVKKHVAVSLDDEKITEEKLDAAFDTILNDPSYMTAVKKLSSEFRDRPMNPMDTAIYWVEYVIRHGGGTILRSPAMDLTWWQIGLFDVYGFLILAIFIIVYLIIFLTDKLIAVIPRSHDSDVKSKKFR